MVGAVGHLTLQPMACTNHKLPGTGGGAGRSKGSEIDSIHLRKSFQARLVLSPGLPTF